MKHHGSRRGAARRTTAVAVARGGALLLAVALPLGAAAGSCAVDLPAPLLDEGCTLNSDCNAPLVCAFQLCHQECKSTRDCPSGERCVAGNPPFHVCQLPSEKSCVSNTQCASGELCAADGQCRDQCASSRDCTPGQLCVGGACAEPTEVSDAGTLLGEPDDAGVGISCQLSSDCGDAGLVCRQGACAVQCNQDIDCVFPQGPGGVCVAHVCGAPAQADAGPDAPPEAGPDAGPDAPADAPDGYGQGCNLPSDCPAPLHCGNAGQCVYECNLAVDCAVGECCVAHACVTGEACAPQTDAGPLDAGGGDACQACAHNEDCDDTLYCDGQERCSFGCCAPALDTPCSSHSACILDTCDEATHHCGHATLAGEDADGDGQLSLGCAGGTDCDDADPTVNKGHLEVYDGKDNDCDGLIDNRASQPKAAEMPFGQYATESHTTLGAPIGGGPGGWMTVLLGSGGNTIASLYDKSGAVTAAGIVGTEPYQNPWPVGSASEVGSALFVAISAYSAQLFGVALNGDGTLAGSILFTSGMSISYRDLADVAWGGSSYIVGWNGAGAGWPGFYALVDTHGNLLGGAQPVPTGMTYGSSAVRVAGNGSTLAVAYQRPDATVELSILNQSGAPTGAPVVVSSGPGTPLLLAVGGTTSGYAVLWTDQQRTYATYVPELASLGSPKTFVADPNGYPSRAQGASDGPGAAFVMQYGTGTSFGYLSGTTSNPFELTQPAPSKSYLSIAGGPGGRLGIFYTDGATLFGRQAGYASLPGADCVLDSNCASQLCIPVPGLTGPKAYSTCQ